MLHYELSNAYRSKTYARTLIMRCVENGVKIKATTMTADTIAIAITISNQQWLDELVLCCIWYFWNAIFFCTLRLVFANFGKLLLHNLIFCDISVIFKWFLWRQNFTHSISKSNEPKQSIRWFFFRFVPSMASVWPELRRFIGNAWNFNGNIHCDGLVVLCFLTFITWYSIKHINYSRSSWHKIVSNSNNIAFIIQIFINEQKSKHSQMHGNLSVSHLEFILELLFFS